MAHPLKVRQTHDRDNMPQMKRSGGGIESHIAFEGLGVRRFPHSRVGDLLDKPALLQNVDNVLAQNGIPPRMDPQK
jgi:hypothetical protein